MPPEFSNLTARKDAVRRPRHSGAMTTPLLRKDQPNDHH